MQRRFDQAAFEKIVNGYAEGFNRRAELRDFIDKQVKNAQIKILDEVQRNAPFSLRWKLDDIRKRIES